MRLVLAQGSPLLDAEKLASGVAKQRNNKIIRHASINKMHKLTLFCYFVTLLFHLTFLPLKNLKKLKADIAVEAGRVYDVTNER